MLSRRVLRIKAMQAVYSFFQSDTENLDAAEKNMLKSIDQIYDLFVYQVSLLIEIVEVARRSMDTARQKYFPTNEELHPNNRFIDNKVVKIIENNRDYMRRYDNLKINWTDRYDLIKKIYLEIKATKEFDEYLGSENDTFMADVKFIQAVYENHLVERDDFQQIYEEQNIHWANDFDIVNYLIVKSLKSMLENYDEDIPFFKLFSHPSITEEKEDKEFVVNLLRKTVIHSEKYHKMIEEKLENWEIERIALMDIILIKMALCELQEFNTIPIKVTLNEYIEMSKIYSTPKSHVFVNGILDKTVKELKENGKIKKVGRGLIE
jgi:N utilization substance protein B